MERKLTQLQELQAEQEARVSRLWEEMSAKEAEGSAGADRAVEMLKQQLRDLEALERARDRVFVGCMGTGRARMVRPRARVTIGLGLGRNQCSSTNRWPTNSPSRVRVRVLER